MANILGTCSPTVMCAAVEITYANNSAITIATASETTLPSSGSAMLAMAGSPRKPIRDEEPVDEHQQAHPRQQYDRHVRSAPERGQARSTMTLARVARQ